MRLIRNYIALKLRWSERYFKTDMIYLFRGGSWLTFGHIFITLISFFLSVAFANYLPKETYGVYRYILATIALIGAFSLTGLSTAIIQSTARGFEVLRSSFRLSFLWSLPVLIISYGGAIYYYLHQNTTLSVSLLIAGTLFPLMNSAGLFASYLNGRKDFQKLSIFNIIDTAVPAITLIITLHLTQNVILILLAYFVSHTLAGAILYGCTLLTTRRQLSDDPEIKAYAIKLSFLNILSLIVAQIDKVLVFTFLGATELAVYGFSVIFPDQIRNVLKNLNSLMIPKISQKPEGSFLGIRTKTFQLVIFVVVVTVIYIVVAPLFYKIFFPQYIDSIYFSRFYALSILSAIAMIPSAILIGYKKEKELARVSIWSSLIQISILLPAIYYYGLLGIITARIISSFINTVISFYMVRAQYQREKRDIL